MNAIVLKLRETIKDETKRKEAVQSFKASAPGIGTHTLHTLIHYIDSYTLYTTYTTYTTYTHTLIHTIHSYTHTLIHSYTHTPIHSNTHTLHTLHTPIHYIHPYATYTHTLIHTHTPIAKFFLKQYSDVQFFLTASFNPESMVTH